MRLKDYAKQCSLRFSNNGTLITPTQDFTLHQYRGRKGAGTYLDYEGAVELPMGDVEDVPFYGRCAEGQMFASDAMQATFGSRVPIQVLHKIRNLYRVPKKIGIQLNLNSLFEIAHL